MNKRLFLILTILMILTQVSVVFAGGAGARIFGG